MNICRNIGTHKYFGYSLKFLSVCWNLKKKKKVKKKSEMAREMLKVLNSEVRNTEIQMKPLSCVAQHGQKVKSSNSCSRIPSPLNQLSVKQPEPPVTGQSQYEGLPDFPAEAATLSN